MPHIPRLAVLASGAGSNLRALWAAHRRGDLPAPIVLVVSNNSGSGALAWASETGIRSAHISATTHADPGAAMLELLAENHVDVLVLAGYMKLLDARVVAAYSGRIVNIHPAPLPRFGGLGMYGVKVHQAVLASGVTTSGPTVHRVNEAYDEGAILAHCPVAVRPGDTAESLASRVLQAEHDLYWRVINDEFCRPAPPDEGGHGGP